jgi:hypothetical protein
MIYGSVLKYLPKIRTGTQYQPPGQYLENPVSPKQNSLLNPAVAKGK